MSEQNAGEALAGAFSFLDSLGRGEFENRDIVGRLEETNLTIDTCWAPDQRHFETGVLDIRYDDAYIIVERYEERAGAEAGHERWVQALTRGTPPAELKDIDMWHMGIAAHALKEAQP